MMTRIFCILAVLGLASVGCGEDKSKEQKTTTTQTPTTGKPAAGTAAAGNAAGNAAPATGPEAKARQIFEMRCVMCHGASGKGDGPAAANINPKPRNYTSRKWQESVTDEHIAEVIHKGGQAMGLNPMMPAQPDLSDEDVKGLVALIRGFGEE